MIIKIKNSAMGCIILLLPVFLISAGTRCPKASKSHCTESFYIKRMVDKITLDGLRDENIWMESTVHRDFIRDFHLILH